jgi:hypothetical protein
MFPHRESYCQRDQAALLGSGNPTFADRQITLVSSPRNHLESPQLNELAGFWLADLAEIYDNPQCCGMATKSMLSP